VKLQVQAEEPNPEEPTVELKLQVNAEEQEPEENGEA